MRDSVDCLSISYKIYDIDSRLGKARGPPMAERILIVDDEERKGDN